MTDSLDEALALHRAGKYHEAHAIYAELDTAEHPNYVARMNSAMLHREVRQPAIAIELLLEVMRECPNTDAAASLGICYEETGRPYEASRWFRRAVDLDPGNASAWHGLGLTCLAYGDQLGARHFFQRSIDTPPRNPTDHANIASSLLMLGEWKAGYDAREQLQHTPTFIPKHTDVGPRWRGEDLQGKTLLVYAEQGHGDTIQMLRYADMLRDTEAWITWQVQEPLQELVRRHVPDCEAVLTQQQKPGAHDYTVPMMSLPYVFGTAPATVPGAKGYLYPPYVGRYRSGLSVPLFIGLAWAGTWAHANDHNRSASPAIFAPLVRESPGTEWRSFQSGPRACEARELGIDVADFSDFSATARALDGLDLLITVDTAVAHLAGAMGVPTWLLLPAVPDMRWGIEGERTPWYGSVRIFRQPTLGDWRSVIARVAKELG